MYSTYIQYMLLLILHCYTHSGFPLPEVSWFKDGEPVVASNSRQIYEDGVCLLQIDKVNLTNFGSYQCVAVNSAGRAVTNCELSLAGKHSHA